MPDKFNQERQARTQAVAQAVLNPAPTISLEVVFSDYFGADWWLELMGRMPNPTQGGDLGAALCDLIEDTEAWLSCEIWMYRVHKAGASLRTGRDRAATMQYISALQAAEQALQGCILPDAIKLVLSRPGSDESIILELRARRAEACRLLAAMDAEPAPKGRPRDHVRDALLIELMERLRAMGVTVRLSRQIAEQLLIQHRIPITEHERQVRRIEKRASK